MASDPKANIQVGIRVRPLLPKEKLNGETEQWAVTPTSITQKDSKLVVTSSCYAFNYVFNQEVETQTIYDTLVKPMVVSSLEGYNATIFAYGQTCSGKTFTIRGEEGGQHGLIGLAIDEISQAITENSGQEEFTVRASYLEIYNEVITDLLNPSKGDLGIHESLSRGVFVDDLIERQCHDGSQLFDVFNDGEANRKYGSTKFNEHSSRSHTVFRVTLNHKKTDHVCKMGILNFVDLAGSERAGQGGAQGIRLKEAGFINKSLLTLGKVISELSRKQSHISFRESKLTRLLSSSLGGNSQTCILCTVSPNVVEETHLTLQFADRAMTITNRPKVNELVLGDDKELRIQYLTQVNEHLTQQLQLLQNSSSSSEDQSGGKMAELMGSYKYFKKRADEYLEELQKERAMQSQLKWELEVILNQNAALQASDKAHHSKIEELESNLNSLHQRFVAERSFAMREHERDMAELITYDDMEFVTVQLEEECQQKISQLEKELKTQISNKEAEIEELKASLDAKAAELEVFQQNHQMKMSLNQTQIQQLEENFKEQQQSMLSELESLRVQNSQMSVQPTEEMKLAIQALEQENNELKSSIKDSKHSVDELTQSSFDLKSELDQANNKIKTLEQENRELKATMEDNRQSIDHLTQLSSTMNAELYEANDKIKKLQSALDARNAEMEMLEINYKSQISSNQAQIKQLEEEKLLTNEVELQAMEEQKQILQLQLEQEKRNSQTLEQENRELKSNVEDSRLSINHLMQLSSSLKNEVVEANDKIREVVKERDQLQLAVRDHSELETLEQENRELKSSVEDSRRSIDHLTQLSSTITNELNLANDKIKELVKERDQLQLAVQDHSELETLEQENRELKATMEDSRQSIGRLTQLSSTMNAELDEANDKIEKLKLELKDSNLLLEVRMKKIDHITDVCRETEDELYEANDKIEVLEQENKELKLSVGNSRQAIDQLTQQSSGLMNLKSDLEKANDKIRLLEQEVFEKIDSLQKLDQEVKEANMLLEAKQKKLDHCTDICTETETELYEASDKIEELNGELAKFSNRCAELQKHNQELEKQVNDKKAKPQDQDETEYLQSKISYLESNITKLKRDNVNTKREVREWEMEAKKHRKEISTLKLKVECLETNSQEGYSYSSERLKEQVGVVEAGMFWAVQGENATLKAEKENAIVQYEKIKKELLRIRGERDSVTKKYRALAEKNSQHV
ncbi:uncharacterized protein [Dysidea avara]|uniref:uncharacterized protein isoform X2 n=1 Tax=Dysidea avara TaxID=196820 RepID=UPI00332821C4